MPRWAPRKRFRDEDIPKIKEMIVQEGMTVRKMAEHFDVSFDAMRQAIRLSGVVNPRRPTNWYAKD